MSAVERIPSTAVRLLSATIAPLLRKAVNFDLSTESVRAARPDQRTTAWAYEEIRDFMLCHGFSHRQYSGYLSNEPMGETQVLLVLLTLRTELPWFEDCVRTCDVTSRIGGSFDFASFLKEIDSFPGPGKAEAFSSTVRDEIADIEMDEDIDIPEGDVDVLLDGLRVAHDDVARATNRSTLSEIYGR